MFKRLKYYDSADIMPIGRYMLAICRDLRYFCVCNTLPLRINKRRLKKSLNKFNSTILKNSDKKQVLNQLRQLTKDEGNIYLYSVLMALIDYCNKLLDAGADEKAILDKLKPIQPLLIERGITPNSKKNIARLDKITRNFKIKSDAISLKMKRATADNERVYEKYLKNLIIIEKTFGIKIDEHKDSVNKYVLLIDEINKHGN